MARRRVVVVGGGISGLAAAWELTGGSGGREDTPTVVVLEASPRLGGPLRSDEFGGLPVDTGPDGFLGRRPEAIDLCREVGLDDALVPIAARGASVWARGRLRALPDGLVLGIPTRFWPTAGAGVLSARGLLGVARDTVLPRPDVRGPIGDRSIGPLVARKLGQQVVDTLVDPLLGGIHAGTVDDMSAAATFPPLLAAAQRRGGLMRGLRAEVPALDADGPPLFWSLEGGMASLVGTLEARLRERGVDIRLSAPAARLERAGAGWTVSGADQVAEADAVVLATPAPAAATLLRPHDDEVAGLLQAIDYASVVLVTFRAKTGSIPAPLRGTGFLVPRRSPHKGREAWAVTACTFLDRKWPHLARDGEVLLRASLGRIDDTRPCEWGDDEVAARAWEELGVFLGVSGQAMDVAVVRHPHSLPQYRVHHLLRTAGVEAAAARLGGVALAGAAYRGVGIPACIASGRAAAHAALVSPRPGGGRVAAASIAAGVLLALSLPPWGWWPLGPLGAALLYWRLGGLSAWTRLWSGWLAGLGCFSIGLAWARSFNWYGAVVLVLLEALFFAAAAGATPSRRGRAPSFVGAYTLAEAARMTWPFGGLPLGGVFLGQADGPLVEVARLGGPLLITASVFAGGVVIATAVAWLRSRQHDTPRPSLVGAVVVAGGIAALVVGGAVAPDGGPPVRTLRVALVQGGGQRGLSKEQVPAASVYEAQVAATFRVITDRPSPALVLWPEDVVALDQHLAGSPQASLMSRLATTLHTTLLVGVTEPASATAFRNEIVAWGPRGHIVAVFEKVHRVPFGEYVPYRSLFSHLANVSGVPTDAVPGHGSGLMRTPAGPLGLLVSFEVFYAQRSHASVRAGAELLAVPTNTSSYSTSQVPEQEIAAAIVQAVETGRDLVQAAPTGYSAVVTQRGVVMERSVLGKRQVLAASVALRRGMTPYDHWGDLPVLILSAVALVAGWTRQVRYS